MSRSFSDLAHNSTLSAEHDGSTAITESDLYLTTREIQSSTAAVERNTAILQAQLDVLNALRLPDTSVSVPKEASEAQSSSQKRRFLEKNLETDQFAGSLRERIAVLTKEIDGTLTSMTTAAQRQTEGDDRMLGGMQKVMSSMQPIEQNHGQIAEIESLCKALVSSQSNAVKSHASEVYLSALKSSDASVEDADVEDPRRTELEAASLTTELDSLIAEVDAVLDMVVDHDYRRHVLNSLKRQDADAQDQQQQWLQHIHASLQHMTRRWMDLSSHYQDLVSYRDALENVSETLMAVSQATRHGTVPQSLPRVAPHKVVQKLTSSTTSAKDPVMDLLRHHGIRLPAELSNDLVVQSVLQSATNEKTSRLEQLSQSIDELVISQMSEAVNVGDSHMQGLLQALYAYSPYGSVNVRDPDFTRRLEELDTDTEKLGDDLRRSDPNMVIEEEKRKLRDVLSG